MCLADFVRGRLPWPLFPFLYRRPLPRGSFLALPKIGWAEQSGTHSEHCYYNEKDRLAHLSPMFRRGPPVRSGGNRANLLDGTAPRDASPSWRRRNDSAVTAPGRGKLISK